MSEVLRFDDSKPRKAKISFFLVRTALGVRSKICVYRDSNVFSGVVSKYLLEMVGAGGGKVLLGLRLEYRGKVEICVLWEGGFIFFVRLGTQNIVGSDGVKIFGE